MRLARSCANRLGAADLVEAEASVVPAEGLDHEALAVEATPGLEAARPEQEAAMGVERSCDLGDTRAVACRGEQHGGSPPGLALLAQHRIREGMALCLEVMEIETWGKRHRITECLKILRRYGGSAKPVLGQLRELEKKLLSHREARGLGPQIELLRKTMAAIEAGDAGPPLRGLDLTSG